MTLTHNDWDERLADVYRSASFQCLWEFLAEAYPGGGIFPPQGEIFNALRLTPPDRVKVVILGQDPYHRAGEAHGLSFSVRQGVAVPPSLRNIFKELAADLPPFAPPNHGCLEAWAGQGVLLLNTLLTVEAGKPRAHKNKGWELFTDAVLHALNAREGPVVFMLWGKDAQKKGALITAPQHLVLEAAHPSPLAGGKFFGCGHFSKANVFLQAQGVAPVDWRLPAVTQT